MGLRKKLKELTKAKGNIEPEVSAEVQVEEEIKDEPILNEEDEVITEEAPIEETHPVYSTAKSGDTLISITKRHKINMKQLLDLNPNLKGKRVIKVCQKIRVK